MAAVVKAINSKIRAHPVLNYVCSTRESALLLSFGIPCSSSSSPSAIFPDDAGHCTGGCHPATADVVAVLEAAPGSDSPSAWGSGHGMLPGAANCPFKLPPPHVAVACPQLCVADKPPRPRPSPLTPLPPDFWGPVSNFGIPLAAVADTQKSPELYVPRPPSPSPRNQH